MHLNLHPGAGRRLDGTPLTSAPAPCGEPPGLTPSSEPRRRCLELCSIFDYFPVAGPGLPDRDRCGADNRDCKNTAGPRAGSPHAECHAVNLMSELGAASLGFQSRLAAGLHGSRHNLPQSPAESPQSLVQRAFESTREVNTYEVSIELVESSAPPATGLESLVPARHMDFDHEWRIKKDITDP